MVKKKGRPDSRERMSVGLNRHGRRRTLVLPPWLEENLGWVTTGSVILAITIGSTIFGYDAGAPSRPTSRSEQAHLVVVLGPLKSFVPGSSDTLQKMTMTVKNLGPASADNVIVEGLIGSQSVQLAGPGTLGVGEQAEYTLSSEVHIPSKSSIVPRYLCWNCPLTPGPAPGHGASGEAVGFERERQVMAGEAN